MTFKNKLVIIVNKNLEPGVAMNAVAHASLAAGAVVGSQELHVNFYVDASGNKWPMSDMPYIVLRGKSGEIKKAVLAAKEKNVMQIAFIGTMTGGTHTEQKERTLKVNEENHEYFAAVIFGEYDDVHQITRKFSLYN